MNQTWLRVLLLLLLLSAALAFTLALSPLTTAQGPAPLQKAAEPHAPTPTAATPPDRSVPGSTDGLVIMSFAIAVIVVVPILLQRSLWKG